MVAILNNLAMIHLTLKRWQFAAENATNSIMLIDAIDSKKDGFVYKEIVKMCGTQKFFVEWRVKSLYYQSQARAELGENALAVDLLKRAMVFCVGDEMSNWDKKVKKLMVACVQRKDLQNKKEKAAARKMFGGGKSSSSSKSKKADAEEKKADGIGFAAAPIRKKVEKKRVAAPFPQAPPSITPSPSYSPPAPDCDADDNVWEDELEDMAGEEDEESGNGGWDEEESEVPWYDEHKEALILAGGVGVLAGLAVVVNRALRR